MIRRNTADQVIYFPQLTLSADGTPVTSSATLTVAKDGVESASAGTLAHSAGGVWKYTPTQGETDCAIVGLILTAADAVPVVLNLVTTGANTAAVAFGANTTAPDNAGITTISGKIIGTLATGTHQPNSGDAFARLGAPAGASIAADIAAIDGGGGGGDAEQATLLLVKAKTDLITSQTAVQQTPALTYQQVIRGDTYDNVANAKLAFTVSKDYTGWTGVFTIRHRVTGAELLSKAVVVTSSTLLNVTLDSTDTAFADLVSDEEFGPHPFDVEMTSSTAVQQAVQGIVIIRKDQTIE